MALSRKKRVPEYTRDLYCRKRLNRVDSLKKFSGLVNAN
jgi:hypothetical protein